MDENLPTPVGRSLPEPHWSSVDIPLHIRMQDAHDQIEQGQLHKAWLKKLDERYYGVEDDKLLAYQRYLDPEEEVVAYARSVGRPGIVYNWRMMHNAPKAFLQSMDKCLTQRTKIDVQHNHFGFDMAKFLDAAKLPAAVDIRANGVHSE